MDTPTFRLFYEDGSLFISWTGEDIHERLQKVLRGVARLKEAHLAATATQAQWSGWEVSGAQKRAEELIQKELMLSHDRATRTKTGWSVGPSQRGRAFPREPVEVAEASVAKADTATDSTTPLTQPDKPTS